jgi:hypothetical protein
MPRAKQLTLSHENLPGMLASIVKVLGNDKVNILSCLTMTSGTTGTTYLVVDNVENAKKALANARLTCTEADVLRLELPNTPGALARFAGKLAQEEINITLGYQTSTKGSRKATIVLAVSDLDKAATIR